jgi:hypothetical protein
MLNPTAARIKVGAMSRSILLRRVVEPFPNIRQPIIVWANTANHNLSDAGTGALSGALAFA